MFYQYPIRIPGSVVDAWENRLTKYGLSLASLRTEGLQYVTDFASEECQGFQVYQFDRELDGSWRKRNTNRLPFPQDGFGRVPVHHHHRRRPEWAMNDKACRAYLEHRFRGLKSEFWRRKAARLWRLFYLAFRVGLHNSEIAELLDSTENSVSVSLVLARQDADRFFKNGGAKWLSPGR